jgi:hypothetical protein
MRRFCFPLMFAFLVAMALTASASSGKIVKVLPHFLDAKGRHALSPSLFDRDAYQAQLRAHPEQRSAIRYDIRWRARPSWGAVKLKLELRGITEGKTRRERTLEKIVDSGEGGSGWAGLALTGDEYRAFGEVIAWRVTLWDGDTLLSEQKSFLW